MLCLVALDGLAEHDLSALVLHLPQSAGLLQGLSVTPIDFSLSASQASWAEILTQTNTFKNGCAGYAHPTSSLNTLAVFTEADLLQPVPLVEVDEGSTSVVINVPVLLPKSANRIWLSDGSLPINKIVSPSNLRAESVFKQYSPRPYKSHAGASGLPQSELIKRCLEVESNRLSCALSLFKQQKWSKFLYRLSVFDQLFHLIGLNFLAAQDLYIFGALKRFLADFDDAIQLFASHCSSQLSFLSCFSHTPCKSTLNLNLVLGQGGFLKLTGESAAARNQGSRLNIANTLWQPSTHYMATLEGRLQADSTIAASPVSGCVYINKSTVFDDGIVADSDYKQARTDVSNYLHNYLSHRFRAFSIEVYPDELNKTRAPDLIVNIEGVEFQNLSDSSARMTPRTTHTNKGFALLPQTLQATKMTSIELASLLNA